MDNQSPVNRLDFLINFCTAIKIVTFSSRESIALPNKSKFKEGANIDETVVSISCLISP